MLLLAGCTAQQTTAPNDLWTALSQLTDQDLATTIQIADSVNPPDQETIQCATYLRAALPSLQGGAQGFIPPTGIASTFETARLVYMQSLGGLSSQQHQALEIACGPLAISVQVALAQGALVIGTGGPGAFIRMLLALALPQNAPAVSPTPAPAPAPVPTVAAPAPRQRPISLEAKPDPAAAIAWVEMAWTDLVLANARSARRSGAPAG